MKMSQAKWIPGKTTMNGSTISSNQYVSTDYALNKTVCTVYREWLRVLILQGLLKQLYCKGTSVHLEHHGMRDSLKLTFATLFWNMVIKGEAMCALKEVEYS